MVFNPIYVLILFAVILIDFFAGIKIEKNHQNKKIWLIISLVSNIGILVFFKYFNFFNENISLVLASINVQNAIPSLDIILPIGLSFHTFQAMSYTIEVYRGNQPAEKNILTYSLYVLYFPQLVAGPIERPQNIIYQLKNSIFFNSNNILKGLFRIALGLFKKVVIADRLALFTDPVFNDIPHANGLTILLAIVFFAFEIYCDFSGYTDIAIGLSNMMGISLMENFKSPYFSFSVTEFWTKWHISLSSWFRDYLYIPLGGNQTSMIRWILIILIVFFLSGLWHGARWNFIVWGGLHGAMIILEKFYERRNFNFQIPSFIKLIFTFSFVSITWLFFRVTEVNSAFVALDHLIHLSINNNLPLVFNTIEMIFVFLLITMLIIFEKFITRDYFKNKLILTFLTCFIFLLGYLFGEFNFKQFIYFQF